MEYNWVDTNKVSITYNLNDYLEIVNSIKVNYNEINFDMPITELKDFVIRNIKNDIKIFKDFEIENKYLIYKKEFKVVYESISNFILDNIKNKMVYDIEIMGYEDLKDYLKTN